MTPTVDVLVERIAALDRLVQQSISSAQLSIVRADTAMEKRFESVNEFRAVLSDQQGTFATRDALDAFSVQSAHDREALHVLYQQLRVDQSQFVTREQVDAFEQTQLDKMGDLQQAVNRMLIALLTTLVVTLISALLIDILNHH